MNTDFAQNTIKLRRIMDKMPNATEVEIKAEYIKNGGLVKDVFVESVKQAGIEMVMAIKATPKKTSKKSVVKVVKEAVKKVTKKK